MPMRVERILEDFRVIALGLDRALAMLGEADHRVGASIDAAECGGYLAMAGQLRDAREGIRRVRICLDHTHGAVGATAKPIAGASGALSAEDVVSILVPASEGTDLIRDDLVEVRSQLPEIIERVAAVANQNPAVGILGTVGQQILGILLDRVAATRRNIEAGVLDARRTQSGEA